jgi:hypothetical protein
MPTVNFHLMFQETVHEAKGGTGCSTAVPGWTGNTRCFCHAICTVSAMRLEVILPDLVKLLL